MLDQTTFHGLFRAYVEIEGIEMGSQLHCLILKLGFDLNRFVRIALFDFYGKCGSV